MANTELKILKRAKLILDIRKDYHIRVKPENSPQFPTQIYLSFTKNPDGSLKITPIRTRKAMARDFTFYPADIFIERFGSSIPESIKDIEKIGVENIQYILLSERNMDEIYYIHKDDAEIEVIIPDRYNKTDEKTLLKVYETPDKGMKKIFNGIFNALIDDDLASARGILQRRGRYLPKPIETMEEIVRTNKKEDYLQYLEEELKKYKNEPVVSKDLKLEKEFLEKYWEVIALISKTEAETDTAKRMENIKKIAKALNFSPMVGKETTRLSVIDFQAGSGRHLKVLEEAGVEGYLFGSELRKFSDDEKAGERNFVSYGVDYNFYKLAFQEDGYTVTGNPKYEISKSIFYLNPPWKVDGKIEADSINSVPDSCFLVGVFSTKQKALLKNTIQGTIFEVPAKEVGYEDPNSPEKVLVVVGKVIRDTGLRDGVATVKELNVLTERDIREAVKRGTFLKTPSLSSVLKNNIEYFSTKKDRLNNLKEIMKKIEEKARHYQELVEKVPELLSDKKMQNTIVSLLTPITKAINGERIFPDVRFFKEKPMLSFYDVIGNISLLSIYKENYPQIYSFIEEVAEKSGVELPKLKDKKEKEYVTTQKLGITKLRFLPRKIPFTKEVEDVIKSVVKSKIMQEIEEKEKKMGQKFSEEFKENFLKEALLPIIDTFDAIRGNVEYLTLKSKSAFKVNSTEVAIGNTSVLVALDKLNRDVCAFNIPLADFYDELEKRGIINLKEKYELAEPDEGLKDKLTKAYIKHCDILKEKLGLDMEKLFSEYVKMRTLKEVTGFISSIINEYNLGERLIRDVFPIPEYESMVLENIRRLVKSQDIPLSLTNKKLKDYLKKIEDLYKKAPMMFLRSRDKVVQGIAGTFESRFNLSRKHAIDLAETIMEASAEHYAILDTVRSGAIKLMFELLETERMKRIEDVNKRFEVFEKLFRNVLKLRPHQYNEAIRFLAKYEKTGEGGHLLGWEMRSGKTLAMLSMGYFSSLVLGKDTYMFPKTANINDIIRQAIGFLPSLSYTFKAYQSGNVDIALIDERVEKAVTNDVFPNIFRIVSGSRNKALKGNKIFIGRGDTVQNLLETYTKEMEELIEFCEQKDKKELEEIVLKNPPKPYDFVFELDGFSEEVRYALYFYLQRIERKGLLDVSNTEGFEALKVSMKRLSESFKTEKRDHGFDFTFHIIPKGQVSVFNYKIPKNVKRIDYQNTLIKTNKDFSFREETERIEDNLELKKRIREFIYKNTKSEFDDYFVCREIMLPHQIMENKDLFTIVESVAGEIKSHKDSIEEPIYVTKVAPKDDLSEEEKETAQELINSLKGQLRTFKDYYCNILVSEALYPVKKSLSIKNLYIPHSYSFNIELSGIITGVQKNKEDYTVRTVKICERKINDKEPSEDVYIPVSVNSSISGKVSKRKRVVDVVINSDKELPIYLSSTANDRTYFVNSRFWKENGGIAIVDEVDEASEPSSNQYRSIFYISRNCKIKVGGTGTPTSGYPEGLVSLMGLISDMPIESIIASMNIARENFSLLETSTKGRKVIFSLFFQTLTKLSYNPSIRDKFLEEFLRLGTREQPLETFMSFYSLMLKYNEGDSLVGYTLQTLKEKANHEEVGKAIIKFVTAVNKEIEKQVGKDGQPSVEIVRFSAINVARSMNLVSRVAGTFDPIGFVSSLEGAGLSLNTRANLKSESAGKNIVEVKMFDYENRKAVAPDPNTGAVNLDRLISHLGGSMPKDELFAPESAEIRRKFDVEVTKYIKDNLLPLVWDYLTENFTAFTEVVKKNPKPFLSHISSLLERSKEPISTKEDVAKALAEMKKKELKDAVFLFIKENGGVDKVLFVFSSDNDCYILHNDNGEIKTTFFTVKEKEKENKEKEHIVVKKTLPATEFPIPPGLGKEKRQRISDILYATSCKDDIEKVLSLSDKEVVNMIAKSTSSKSDSIVDIVKSYMRLNFDWEAAEREMAVDNKTKMVVAKVLWREYIKEFVSNMEDIVKEYLLFKERKDNKDKDEDEEKFKWKTKMGYTVPTKVYYQTSSEHGDIVSKITSIYTPSGKLRWISFSEEIQLKRKIWESAGIKPINFRLTYLSSSDSEVIDSFTNKQYFATTRKMIADKSNFLIASPRIVSFEVAVYDAIANAYDLKQKGVIPEDREIIFLLRATTQEMKNRLKELANNEKLKKANITVKVFRNNAELDAESQKMKKIISKEVKEKGETNKQLIVASTDDTIARGVDLSHLDEMIVYGANSSGKTASQLFARLFNATDKHEAKITIYGTPIRIDVSPRGEERIMPAGSFYKTDGLLGKINFIDSIMSGKLINIANLTTDRVVELTKLGKELIEKIMDTVRNVDDDSLNPV